MLLSPGLGKQVGRLGQRPHDCHTKQAGTIRQELSGRMVCTVPPVSQHPTDSTAVGTAGHIPSCAPGSGCLPCCFLYSHSVLPKGFSPRQVHYGFNVTKEITVERSWGERVYTQLYSHGGRSITEIPSTQSESACSKLVSASGPLRQRGRTLVFSARTAVLRASVLGTATTPASALLSCSLAAMPPCHTEHWAEFFN